MLLVPEGAAGEGELLCCTYMPDGAFVLSGGWDGHLRLWDTTQGGHVTALRTGDKPVSACSVTPDGKYLLSGGLDGLLGFWDALIHLRRSCFLAHPRPVSGIAFGLDGQCFATSSWDGSLIWWKSVREREAKTFTGHRDIVAGCRLTPDGQGLLSWSHDTNLKLWDIGRGLARTELRGHTDKVLSADVSPDGKWAASGGRDGSLKLWDLATGKAVASLTLDDEINACLFLPDGATLVTADRFGRMTWHAVPGLGQLGELAVKIAVSAAARAPAGSQIALACGDGRVRLVAVDGLETAPLFVPAIQGVKRQSRGLQKLFGRSTLTYTYSCTCPACRRTFELPGGEVGQARTCPGCRRALRVAVVAPSVAH